MFSFLFKTEVEKKRDKYQKLYKKLNEIITAHDEFISEINTTYTDYTNTVPRLAEMKIPSDDFEPKRIELTDRLNKIYDADKQKRLDLIIARDRALGRYEYYRQLAIDEAKDS